MHLKVLISSKSNGYVKLFPSHRSYPRVTKWLPTDRFKDYSIGLSLRCVEYVANRRPLVSLFTKI